MSANQESSSTSTPRPARKPRNPIERFVVWVGILILLVLVGIEYTSSRSQSAAADNLMAKMRASETGNTDVKAADVKAAVNGKTPRVLNVRDKNLKSGARQVEVYNWFTLSPLKRREIYVYYGVGEDPDVLSVTMEEDTDTVVFVEPTPEERQAIEEFIAEREKQRPAAESDGEAEKTDGDAEKTPESTEPPETSPADAAPNKE